MEGVKTEVKDLCRTFEIILSPATLDKLELLLSDIAESFEDIYKLKDALFIETTFTELDELHAKVQSMFIY